jgi:glutaredoxin domain-containing cysteine-rich protein 1
MGCTASRDGSAFSDRDRERFGSRRRLGKSSSFTALRSSKPRDLHYDYHVVALTSSTYGLMKLLESENVNEHLASVIGGKGGKDSDPAAPKMRKADSMPTVREIARPKTTWTDMAMASSVGTVSRFKLEQLRKEKIEAKFPLNPKIPEEEAPVTPPSTPPSETINTWELMEGLDDQIAAPQTPPSTTITDPAIEVLSSKPLLKPALSRSRSLSAVDGLRVAKQGGGNVADFGNMDSTSSVTQISTNNGYSQSNRGSIDFSSRGSMDFSSTGFPLEFSQRMSGELHHSGAMEFAQRYSGPLSNAGLPSGQVIGIPVGQQFQSLLGSHVEDSALFDPDILATFQDLITTTSSDDDWCHIRSSDGEASTSGSTADDESPWAKISQFGASAKICDSADSHSGTYGPRFEDPEKARFRAILDPLMKYEERCPPGGDDRVVLYLTSLRGIRKTFEDCHSLRMILQSFPVWVDERDVSMHAEFRQELKDLVGGPVIVPRVFVKGRYIGGSEEVRRLHEDGKLAELLNDLPVVHFRKPCDGCGGVRFVPCPDCSGSCKIITDANEVARCPDCNENGLIRCPVCF